MALDEATYSQFYNQLSITDPSALPAFQELSALVNASMAHVGFIELYNTCTLARLSSKLYISSQLVQLALVKGEFNRFCTLLEQLFARGYAFIVAFLGCYPALQLPINRIEEDVLALSTAALKEIKKSEKVLEFCLIQGVHDVPHLLALFRPIAEHSPGFLPEALDIIALQFNQLSRPFFYQWADRGGRLFRGDRIDEGISFIRMQTRESRRLLGEEYAVPADVSRFLNFFTTSISGLHLEVEDNTADSFGFSVPYSDGSVIYLPPRADYFPESRDNERVYSAFTAIIAAYFGRGTLEFELKNFSFRQSLVELYGTSLAPINQTLDSHYLKLNGKISEAPTGELMVILNKEKLLVLETELEKFFFSFPTPNFMRHLFGLLENRRLEQQLCYKYEGLREDIELVNRKTAGMISFNPAWRGDRKAILSSVTDQIILYCLTGRFNTAGSPEAVGELLEGFKPSLEQLDQEKSTVYHSAQAAFVIYNQLFEKYPLVLFCRETDLNSFFRKTGKPEIMPEVIYTRSPQLFPGHKGYIHAAFEPPEEEQEGNPALDLTRMSIKTRKSKNTYISTFGTRKFTYPEYDYKKRAYTQEHCTLYERILRSDSDNEYCKKVLLKYRKVYKQMKKSFLIIQPEELEISRRWDSGDDIDISDTTDYLIDLQRGTSVDDRIYSRRIRNLRDISVAILLDISSSTHELVEGRPIIEIEKEALCLFGSVLSSVGDSFAIYAYNSSGPDNIQFYILKEFNEAWNDRVKGRISSCTPSGANRDGCAVRHCLYHLQKEESKTKILFLLSDGIPADDNYGSATGADTSDYAIEDTRKAILECKSAGIFPFCITIDKKAKQYISHLYGAFNFTIISRISRLPDRLIKFYLKITK